MVTTIFPNYFFWHFKAPNAEELISVLEKKENVLDKNETWGMHHNSIKTYLDPDSYFQYLAPSLQIITDELKLERVNYSITDIWTNEYHKGHNQELHDHAFDDLVCVFFLNDGDDFAKFFFYDTNAVAFSKVWKSICFNNTFMPDVKSGDILFFPSHMLHGVSPHKSDVVRKTLSVNFQMRLE